MCDLCKIRGPFCFVKHEFIGEKQGPKMEEKKHVLMVAMEERERRDFLKRSRNVFGRVSEFYSRFPIDFGVKKID